PPIPALFPYTTLFRSKLTAFLAHGRASRNDQQEGVRPLTVRGLHAIRVVSIIHALAGGRHPVWEARPERLCAMVTNNSASLHRRDRKSTRLNSSHVSI